MDLYDIIFYIFALITVLSGIMVVFSRNIVYSAFSLLFTFFGVTGLYVLLGADFVAVVQLIVYVGGILILLLFGVMITNKITSVDIKSGTINLLPVLTVTTLFFAALVSVMVRTNWVTNPAELPSSTIYTIGRLLLNDYVLIFELLAVLLLIALIGAASVARRNK